MLRVSWSASLSQACAFGGNEGYCDKVARFLLLLSADSIHLQYARALATWQVRIRAVYCDALRSCVLPEQVGGQGSQCLAVTNTRSCLSPRPHTPQTLNMSDHVVWEMSDVVARKHKEGLALRGGGEVVD